MLSSCLPIKRIDKYGKNMTYVERTGHGAPANMRNLGNHCLRPIVGKIYMAYNKESLDFIKNRGFYLLLLCVLW